MSIRLEEVSKLPQVSPNQLNDFVIGVQKLPDGNYRAVLNPVSAFSGGGGGTGNVTVNSVNLIGTDSYAAALTGYTRKAFQVIFVTFENANTGPVTANIEGSGIVAVKVFGGDPLNADYVVPGAIYGMIDDGTNYQIFSITKNIATAY